MTTLFDLFDAQDHFQSGRLAMSMRLGLREERWSYAEFRRAIESIAHRLLSEHHLAPGDRVIIQAPNAPQSALALYGIMRAGLIAVPMDVGATRQFVEDVARMTEARLILGLGDSPSLLTAPQLEIASLITSSNGPGIPCPRAADIAEIVFTSGTTGLPKGVMLTHGNLAANAKSILSVVPPREPLRLLSVLPLSHMFEQTVGLAMPLILGGSVHYATGRHSTAIRRALKRHRITCMVAVPQLLELLYRGLEREARNRETLLGWDRACRLAGHLPIALRRFLFRKVIDELGGDLSFFMSGGAYLPPELTAAWERLGIRVLEGYGVTECSPVIASNRIDDRLPGSVGRTLPGVSVRIAEDGEVQVRGDNVTSGYWEDPEQTASLFTDDHWLRTGDLARMDSSGRLTLLGRSKDMIVLPSGMNVYPEDVERVLSAQSGIDDCAVVGVHDPGGGVHVEAAICSESSDADLAEAVRHANSSLADHQRITVYKRWPADALPKTALMKVKRSEVRKILEAAGQPTVDDAASDQNGRVQKLVARICKRSPDSIHEENDLWLDIGLDSLARVELLGALEVEYGIELTEEDLGSIRTIGELSRLVGEPRPYRRAAAFPEWPRSGGASFVRSALQSLIVFPLHRLVTTQFAVSGLDRLEGISAPCLFVANHASHVDTLSVLRALPKRLRTRTAVAAAADYFFKTPTVAFLAAVALNLFPFSRSGNIRESLEHCGDLADEGWCILIYPEGTRSQKGRLLPFKPGIGLLGTGLATPIVPVGVTGGFDILPKGKAWPRRAPVTVTFGEAIHVETTEDPVKITKQLETAVNDLLPDALTRPPKTETEVAA